MKPGDNIDTYIAMHSPHPDGEERTYKFNNGRGARATGKIGGKWALDWIIWTGDGPRDYILDKYMETQTDMSESDMYLCLSAIGACESVRFKNKL